MSWHILLNPSDFMNDFILSSAVCCFFFFDFPLVARRNSCTSISFKLGVSEASLSLSSLIGANVFPVAIVAVAMGLVALMSELHILLMFGAGLADKLLAGLTAPVGAPAGA